MKEVMKDLLSFLWIFTSRKVSVFSCPYFHAFELNTEIYEVNFPYSVRMRENTYQKNSECGYLLRSVDNIFKDIPNVASFFFATNAFKESTRKDEGNYKRVPRNCKSKYNRTKVSILQDI